MTNGVAIRNEQQMVAQVSRYDDPIMVNVIKQTVCKGASDAQLSMFLEVCKRTGLDPFLKEIWFVAEKSMIMAARDGYLRVANEHPMFDGIETRVERDDRMCPVKAVCTVWRKDRTHPTICEAYYNEYKAGSPVWTKYPSAMISKVAEVLALKRSFAINGVVSEEEMGGADDRGSAEAAQTVAQQKIAAATRTVEVLPAPQPSAEELHADIVAHHPKEPKKPSKSVASRHIDMLQAFGGLKKRYQAIGLEKTYYAVLGRFGVEKSNEFPATDEGLRSGLACYREMQLNVSDLEAMKAKEAAAMPTFDAWAAVREQYSDELAEALGLRIVVSGKVYARESFDQTWSERK